MAFLNSGSILHPILAKSQCWCVDGVSKFVLRIRPNSYYRIELPHKSPQDVEKVEEFKSVLANVLQYEVTPCPFKRGFTVEIPEPPTTPVQRRPWRPRPLSRATSTKIQAPEELEVVRELDTTGDPTPRTSEMEDTEEKASRSPPPAGGSNTERLTAAQSDTSSIASTDNEQDSEATDDTRFTHKELHEKVFEEPRNFKTPTRPKRIHTGRTVTAPPQLTLRTTPPSTNLSNATKEPSLSQESLSMSSSVDSFHSFHSPISPLPQSPSSDQNLPSPGSIADGFVIPRSRGHKRDVSELTITGNTPDLWDISGANARPDSRILSTADPPKTPTLISDVASQDEDHWDEAKTLSPATGLRNHRAARKKRPYSPLPSSSNLYSPYSPRSHISGHHMTTAILQRTCSLLLGPPVQLVALMLRIAVKIARGTMRGSSFGYGEGGQKIPCSWDFGDGSDDSDDMWEEDDYGVSLGKTVSGKDVKGTDIGGSWEID